MINSTSKTGSALPPQYVAKKSTTGSQSGSQQNSADSLNASSLETLQGVLQSQPEVRPEVVSKGQQLAADSKYPPLEIIQKLSEMLVNSRDLSNHE